jgi:hypothetical protein
MSDARAWQSAAGLRPIDPPVVAALDALRAGDLDVFSDWLHETHFPTTPVAVAALRSLAESIVGEGLGAGFAPTATVDEITTPLVGRCGLRASADVIRASGDTPRRPPPATGRDESALRHDLSVAQREITRLQAERDALESRVEELAGARVLADALAAELERDEWIRARLRRLKATRAVRGLIYARRRVRSRTNSSANR